MPRRGAPARRSAVEWGVRGVLAIAALVAGYASVTRTLAYALRAGAVERAHALAPGDGRIAATLAQTLAGPDATAADRTRADDLARTALRQDPTAVAAVSTLGIDAQVRGDTARARRLFGYSETLSRRDFQTQLWAVENSVGRGDVAGALRHYDIALRTSRAASDLLFPILSSAITDPAIRSALLRTLLAKPNWGGEFIGYVASNGSDRRATAALLLGLRRKGVDVSDEVNATILSHLVTDERLEDAWRYYAAIRPGVDRRRSRDSRFAATFTVPSLFDWVPINDGGVSTTIQRVDGGGIVDISAPPTVGGALLQQMQMLPPGTYRLDGRTTGIEQPEGTRPYWVLNCRDGRELGRVDVPNSAQANGVFAGRFTVPSGCPAQMLALVARPSDLAGGLSGQIGKAVLRPAN